MVVFDDAEYRRWSLTADDHLRVARHDAAGGFHSAAVLQAGQSVQCGLKALLHGDDSGWALGVAERTLAAGRGAERPCGPRVTERTAGDGAGGG